MADTFTPSVWPMLSADARQALDANLQASGYAPAGTVNYGDSTAPVYMNTGIANLSPASSSVPAAPSYKWLVYLLGAVAVYLLVARK